MSSIKIIQVIGARPQIIKSAALYRAVSTAYSDRIELITLHTGQHYDPSMSAVFFEDLTIPRPEIQLDCGGGSHAEQTSNIMLACEQEFLKAKPDAVLVYGDTNSTLAAALCANKMGIPVLHVEAGLRSHNLEMPEECNRIATDHLSTLLFCPTEQAVAELSREGLPADASSTIPRIISCGDVMLDNSLHFAARYKDNNVDPEIILASAHRPSNTDDPAILEGILNALVTIGRQITEVYFPIHPRLEKHVEILAKFRQTEGVKLIAPVSFQEMIQLLKRAKCVITDSGGLQKEAFFMQRPCVVLREETEWVELVNNGNSILAGNKPEQIVKCTDDILSQSHSYPNFYGDGTAARQICEAILESDLIAC